ncbi:MAG: metallophosphoesterase family protein [Bacteroidales bacterium]
MSTFVIADIHGCVKTLRGLVEDRLKVNVFDNLYFLGDYIDRGPDSAGVIDYIAGLQDLGCNVTCLMGNHEHLLLNSMHSNSAFRLWMINSGKETLKSYGIKSTLGLNILRSLPPRHLAFLKGLKYYSIVNNRFILVHGGLNYNMPDPFSGVEALLWNRPKLVPDGFMPGFTIIHGHTPTPVDQINANLHLKGTRLVGLDAGCVYKGLIPGTGFLVALNLDDWTLEAIECMD